MSEPVDTISSFISSISAARLPESPAYSVPESGEYTYGFFSCS